MGQLESVYIEGIDDIDNDSILHGDLTVERVAKIIKNGEVKNIVVMSGAGISVSQRQNQFWRRLENDYFSDTYLFPVLASGISSSQEKRN